MLIANNKRRDDALPSSEDDAASPRACDKLLTAALATEAICAQRYRSQRFNIAHLLLPRQPSAMPI
jgi:hypothetical protein